MDFLLEKEANSTKHSFCVKFPIGTKHIRILNAADSPYHKGWKDYAPFESKEGSHWTRLKAGHYDGTSFSFHISHNVQYACWFPSYDMKRIPPLRNTFKKMGNNAYFVGNKDNPTLVLLAGQHPAETMSLYFLEGFLKKVARNKTFLNSFSILFFPFINKEGLERQCHRLTPTGEDLNRAWADPNNHILNNIKKHIAHLKKLPRFVEQACKFASPFVRARVDGGHGMVGPSTCD